MENTQDPIGYHTLELLSGADNYNRWMFKSLAPYCEGNILEIGSGVGNISECLLVNFEEVTLSDLRIGYCEILQKKFHQKHSLKGVLQIDIAQIQFHESYNYLFNKFDTIVALNVIEHIKDHSFAINNCKKLLKNGGKLIILVPAYQWLYNPLDKMLEHFRRYSRQSVKSLLIKQDLKIIHAQYFNAAGIFGWWLTGKIFKNKTIPEKNILLYNKFTFLFKILDRLVFYQFGLSVLTVATKQNPS